MQYVYKNTVFMQTKNDQKPMKYSISYRRFWCVLCKPVRDQDQRTKSSVIAIENRAFARILLSHAITIGLLIE